MSEETTTKKSKKLKLPGKRLIVLVAFVIALGTAGYFYREYSNLKNNTEEVIAAKNKEESENILEVLKQNLLIEDDAPQPTVARVDNPEVLKEANKDFYKNAQVDDYLILYPNRAILFREKGQLIVNVAPIINTDDLKGNGGTKEEKPAESGSTAGDSDTQQ